MAASYGLHPEMRNADEDDTASKGRERRRRRIEMRRLTGVPGAGSSSSLDKSSFKEIVSESPESKLASRAAGETPFSGEEADAEESSGAAANFASFGDLELPVFGMMSVAGRMRDMEDAVTVRTNLCRPEINRRLPVHFFGVYDGHGGPYVAAICRDMMHVLMEEELMRVQATEGGVGSNSSSGGSLGPVAVVEVGWRQAMSRCFNRMDELVLGTCACGTVGHDCGTHPADMALTGSTAVVAVITAQHIVVANCGDSRAVLCHDGRAIPLSRDHKPDRRDEQVRVQALGGRVIHINGARVEGLLAMSRAIGDKLLKPYVIAEPEISFTQRNPEDECLILASDGLWDVVSNDLACDVAHECLQEGDSHGAAGPRIEGGDAGAIFPSRSASAAALLARLAMGRKSCDNISVVVVDLKC